MKFRTDIREKGKNERKRIFAVVGALSIAFLVILEALELIRFFTNQYPYELREGVNIQYAIFFSQGINPYSIDSLRADVPYPVYAYGFLMPLILGGFLSVFRMVAPILLCRVVSYLVKLLGIWLFALAIGIKESENPNRKTMMSVGALLFAVCYWRYSWSGGVFPDTWGLTGGALLYYLFQKDLKKGKPKPVVYALIIVAVFYVKQYFILMAVPIAFWFLLKRQWKEFGIFALAGILMGGGSILVVNSIFPLYFTQTVYFMGTFNATSYQYSINHLKIIRFYALLFLAIAVYTVRVIRKKEVEIAMESTYLFEYMAVVLMGLLLFFTIGKSDGTIYTYHFQLWIPYVIPLGLKIVDARMSRMDHRFYAIALLIIVLCPAKMYSTGFMYFTADPAWEQIEEITGAHSHLYLSEVTSFCCIREGIYSEDMGQGGFTRSELHPFAGSRELTDALFPCAGRIKEIHDDYRDKAGREETVQCEYLVGCEDAPKGYHLEQTISLKEMGQKWEVTICKRNER